MTTPETNNTTTHEGEPMDLDALLTRAEVAREASWEDAQVVLAGEIVDVRLARVDGTAWVELVAAHHPRTAADGQFGYDAQAVSRVYPRVRVAGIDIAADAWTRLYDALDKINQNTVDAAVWGVNVFTPERTRLQALRDASDELATAGVSEADVQSAAAGAEGDAGRG